MNQPITTQGGKLPIERYFYSISAALLLVLTVVGFQLFYFHGMAYPGRPLTPPIKPLVISHGLMMSVWILLSVVQPFLVANNNRRLHMTLGKVGAIIAVGVIALGFMMGVSSARVAPPGLMYGPMTPKQFMIVPIGAIVLFTAFVVIGVIYRKRPEIHKPMMFMATQAAVSAAVGRIVFLNNLYAGTIWEKWFSVFFFSVVIGVVFVIAKWIAFRKLDRWFIGGTAVMCVWFFILAQGAMTPAWDKIAGLLLS